MRKVVRYNPCNGDSIQLGQRAYLGSVVDHPNVTPNGRTITSIVLRCWPNEDGKLDFETYNSIYHAV